MLAPFDLDMGAVRQLAKLAIYDLVELVVDRHAKSSFKRADDVVACRDLATMPIERDGHLVRMVMLITPMAWGLSDVMMVLVRHSGILLSYWSVVWSAVAGVGSTA
jgi:hypothetical protein